jgi:Mg/Co/Ni transporter MgtE
VGNLPLTELFFADQTKQLAAIMRTDTSRIFADAPIKSLHNHPAWYDYLAIPVIDRSGRLIGILAVENYQKSNAEPDEGLSKEVLETSSALGELYRIGLTGFLQSISK